MAFFDRLKTDLLGDQTRRAAKAVRNEGRHRGAYLFLRERLELGDALAVIKLVWAPDWPELANEIDKLNEIATAASDLDTRLRARRAGRNKTK